MSNEQVMFSTLTTGTEYRYRDDPYTYTVVSRTKKGIRYKVTSDTINIHYHKFGWPDYPVTIISNSHGK